jgi:DNA polymerase-3 subunit epsilon
MFHSFFKKWQKKRLKDEKYLFLFEECCDDEVVVFDTETSGLNPEIDQIVSIGAVKIKGNRILLSEKFHIYIKGNLKEEAIKIHQIRKHDLQNGESIENGIEQFLNFIGSRPVVGYYLQFDVAMINREVRPKLGVGLPNKKIEVSELYFDKMQKKFPHGNIDLKFDTILKELQIPTLGKHDALNDAIMTAMIYLKLKK